MWITALCAGVLAGAAAWLSDVLSLRGISHEQRHDRQFVKGYLREHRLVRVPFAMAGALTGVYVGHYLASLL